MKEFEKPKIDLKECKTIKCEKCDGIYFREVLILKKVPKIMTGSPEDTNVPFSVIRCDDCNHINSDQEIFN